MSGMGVGKDAPETQAGVCRLDLCVRCGRPMGWSPDLVEPGVRVGGSKMSGCLERYACLECVRKLREYWR